jgi:hypothetical protein
MTPLSYLLCKYYIGGLRFAFGCLAPACAVRSWLITAVQEQPADSPHASSRSRATAATPRLVHILAASNYRNTQTSDRFP